MDVEVFNFFDKAAEASLCHSDSGISNNLLDIIVSLMPRFISSDVINLGPLFFLNETL